MARGKPATTMSSGVRADLLREMAEPAGDELNALYLFATVHSRLLLAVASGVIDAQQMARSEMAHRALDANGEGCSFGDAARVWVENQGAPGDLERAQQAASRVAADCLKIDLQTQGSDSLDFHDVAVWTLREALVAAYQAGAASK